MSRHHVVADHNNIYVRFGESGSSSFPSLFQSFREIFQSVPVIWIEMGMDEIEVGEDLSIRMMRDKRRLFKKEGVLTRDVYPE